MTILDYLNSLRPALPFSSERPCTLVSQSELRRWIGNGSVTINFEKCTIDEELDFVVHSLIFFPKSAKRKTTLI